MAYFFFLGDTLLPVTPAKLTVKVKNQNKTVDLINQYEVNILKQAGLTEIKFEALLPNVRYPFALYNNGFKDASYYLSVLEKYKKSKKPFQFIVSRKMPTGRGLAYTNIKVSLESYDIKESAGDGFDFVVSIELKQYREYGAKTATIKTSSSNNATVSKNSERDSKDASGSYVVKSGDTLWNISKESYGTATDWKQIYNANKNVIESAAKDHGKLSSSNGWWIYPGTKLVIP